MKRRLLWAPLLAFVAVLGVIAVALWRPADRTIRSALIGQPFPAVALPAMLPERPGTAAPAGKARLVNVFASWCVPCIAEAPQLMRLKQMGIPIEAVAVRDTPAGVREFLQRYGDPYRAIVDDAKGKLQLTLGSSGVPETFVVDGNGRILAQHVSNIQPDDVERIAAMVARP